MSDSDWPKRFEPDENGNYPDELDALESDDDVRIYEDGAVKDPDGGLWPILVAHHADHSPSTWIRLDGVTRDELSDGDKYWVNEKIMESFQDSEAHVESISWFTDDEIETKETVDDLRRLLRDFVAMERDRELGFPGDELHRWPRQAIVEALELLETLGDDPDEIVWPEDQETLGIEVSNDA